VTKYASLPGSEEIPAFKNFQCSCWESPGQLGRVGNSAVTPNMPPPHVPN
jgi:hypothetical protein